MINSRKGRNGSLAFATRIANPWEFRYCISRMMECARKKPAIYIYILGFIIIWYRLGYQAFHRCKPKSFDTPKLGCPGRSFASKDGSVLTWGDPEGGGDSRFVQMQLEGVSLCFVIWWFWNFCVYYKLHGYSKDKGEVQKKWCLFLMHSEEQSLFKSYSKTERQWSKMQFLLLGHAWTLSQQRMRCGYFLHSYSLCCTEEGWRWLCSKGGSHWQAPAFQELGVVE